MRNQANPGDPNSPMEFRAPGLTKWPPEMCMNRFPYTRTKKVEIIPRSQLVKLLLDVNCAHVVRHSSILQVACLGIWV